MPNPWESSSSQLKSILPDTAAAKLVPPARLIDVMLPPARSSWQARVHNKFEEFSQVSTMICVKLFLDEIQPRTERTADRPSRCSPVMADRNGMARN
jgi:hypothetical protein